MRRNRQNPATAADTPRRRGPSRTVLLLAALLTAAALGLLWWQNTSADEESRSAPPVTQSSIETGIDTEGGGDGSRFLPSRYLVRPGDTLISVADLHAIDVDLLLDELDATLSDTLTPGDTIEIPVAEPTDPPDELLDDPERIALVPILHDAAAEADIPASLLMAFTWRQSEWDADLEVDGGFGLGRLRLETVERLNDEVLGGAALDPRSAADNARLTAALLADVLTTTDGDHAGTLAAIFTGLRNRNTNNWDLAVNDYVSNVLALTPAFSGTLPQPPPPTTTTTSTTSTTTTTVPGAGVPATGDTGG